MIVTKPRLIFAPQRTEEWFIARKGNVTGSEVNKTILDPSESAIHSAIRQITGQTAIYAAYKKTDEYRAFIEMDKFELFEKAELEIPETEERKKYRRYTVASRIYPIPFTKSQFVTEEMKWGQVSEPIAIASYQMKNRLSVEPAPFFLHQTIDTITGEVEQLRAGASPDGLVEDINRPEGLTLGVVEVKCLTPENHLYEVIDFRHVPIKYIPQIQMEIWITGRSFCDFIGFDSRAPEGLKILIERIERDDQYIDTILEPNVRRFLDECDRDERRFRAKIRERKELRQEIETIYSITPNKLSEERSWHEA